MNLKTFKDYIMLHQNSVTKRQVIYIKKDNWELGLIPSESGVTSRNAVSFVNNVAIIYECLNII